MQDDQCTSNNTSMLCFYIVKNIKEFLSENVLDEKRSIQKFTLREKKLFCVEELLLQKRSTYKPYLRILDKHVFWGVNL